MTHSEQRPRCLGKTGGEQQRAWSMAVCIRKVGVYKSDNLGALVFLIPAAHLHHGCAHGDLEEVLNVRGQGGAS